MSLVLDSSMTLAWYFQDEASEETDLVLSRVADSGAVVPVHWRAEVANAFQMAIRRGRIDAAYRDCSLTDLLELDVEIDQDSNTNMWGTTISIAEAHGLTIYDAAYLELAQRRRLGLASLDRALCAAAAACGVVTLAKS